MNKLSAFLYKTFLSLCYMIAFASQALADDRTCTPYHEVLADGKGDNFILKGTYEIIAKACTNVAEFSWKQLAEPLQVVIALAGAIYIAVYTLKNIGTFSQQDVSAYLTNDKTGVILVGVKTGAVIWLLGNQSFLYEYIVGLAVNTGMEIGRLINGSSGISGAADNIGGLFNQVIKQIQAFNDEIYSIVATGRVLLCLGMLTDGFFLINWHWFLILTGLVLYIYGWLIVLSVSFYMLDVLFRLGVGAIVLPLAVACGFSKLTSNYTKKTWDLFINVAFNFVMLGVVIKFTTSLLQQCTIGNIELAEKLNIGEPLSDSDVELIEDILDGPNFILVTFCCLISFKLFGEVEQIADKISSTSSVGKLGQQLGAAASAPVIKGAKNLGSGAWALGGDIRRETGKSIKNSNTWVGSAVRGTEQGIYRTQRAVSNAASKTEGFLFGTGRNANLNIWKRGWNAVKRAF